MAATVASKTSVETTSLSQGARLFTVVTSYWTGDAWRVISYALPGEPTPDLNRNLGTLREAIRTSEAAEPLHTNLTFEQTHNYPDGISGYFDYSYLDHGVVEYGFRPAARKYRIALICE